MLAVVVIASSPVVLAWYRLLSGYLAGVRAHPGTWGYLIRDATVKSSIGVAVVLGYAASPAIFWWLARRRLRRPSREPSPAPGGL